MFLVGFDQEVLLALAEFSDVLDIVAKRVVEFAVTASDLLTQFVLDSPYPLSGPELPGVIVLEDASAARQCASSAQAEHVLKHEIELVIEKQTNEEMDTLVRPTAPPKCLDPIPDWVLVGQHVKEIETWEK